MQVILLEKVVNLGDLGDVVRVRNGYARNFLIPRGIARRATPEAIKEIEAQLSALKDRKGVVAELIIIRDSRRESGGLRACHEQARTCPLPYDQLAIL